MKQPNSFTAFRFCKRCEKRFKPKGKDTKICDDCVKTDRWRTR